MSGQVSRHRLKLKRDKKRLVFDALFTRQQGKCAICSISQGEFEARHKGLAPVHTKLHIDHCHRTRRIRGLLCSDCNARLAVVESYGFREKPEEMSEEDFTHHCEFAGRWIEEHWEALFQYMQYDRWLPTKDILFHLRARQEVL